MAARHESRYKNAAGFEDSDQVQETFQGLRPRDIATLEGVIEHRVVKGDRLDSLARQYYNDDRLWWRIVDANPESIFGSDLVADDMVGRTILIPRAAAGR